MGDIYATDDKGVLHKAPAGTELPSGWKVSKPPSAVMGGGNPNSFMATHGKTREAILGGFSGLGIPETMNPVKDMGKGLADTFGPPKGTGETITNMLGLGILPATRIAKGVVQQGGQFVREVGSGKGEQMAHGAAGLTTMLGSMLLGGKKGGPAAAEAAEAGAKAVDAATKTAERVTKAGPKDVMGELEKYRKTVNEPPNKTQRLAAQKVHAALTERVNQEWTELYDKLKTEPTDALQIRESLKKLAAVEPMTKKWLDTHIQDTMSGKAVTVPQWKDVRALSSTLNEMLGDEEVTREAKAEIPEAHKALEDVLKSSAEKQGMGKQYTQAYQMSRKLNNIKHHTAYQHVPKKPSPLWGLGGAAAGIYLGAGMGGSGELGSAFMGKMVGSEIGKALTPKSQVGVPELSVAGEKQMWRDLRTKPPRGANKKIMKTDRIVHYQQP